LKNKHILRLVLAWSLTLFIFASLVHAGTVGKISGVVKDKQSGEPLPGASIQIVGTQMGAATNPKGEYFIINVPPGKYTVKASLIGYAPMEVQNVDVSVDLTTFLDFPLVSQAIELGKGITVVAERPLLIKDQTASIRVMEAEELQNMPTRGYQEAISLQSGVVSYTDNPNTRLRGDRENTNTPALNIRGGRSSEVAYYVDGFSQQDYLTGNATTAINQNAIQEVTVTTGGFNAEYGKIMSGAINVVTKEGGAKYSGNVELVTDNGINSKSERYDYNLYDLSLSGPLIPGNDKTSFFISGERRWQGDRSPSGIGGGILKNNTLGGYTWQGKFGFKLTNAMDLKLGTLGSIDDWREYRNAYLFDASHMPRYLDKNYSYFGTLTHNLSPSLFYTLSVNFFSTERKRGDGVHFDHLRDYGRPEGNPDYDIGRALFYYGDDPNTPIGRDADGFITGDEGHVWDDYLHRKSSYYGLDFALTNQINQYNQIKAGFEFQRHTLRFYDHLWPVAQYRGLESGGYQDVNNFGYDQLGEESDTSFGGLDGAKHPITFALYLQDKVEWRGLILNAGLRWDYLDPKTKRLKEETNPLDSQGQLSKGQLEDSKAHHQFSPRLGVGFPVTDRTVFHFSYGKFFQQPELQNLYVSYRYLEYKVQTGGYYYAFGNPNLKPEQTTAYEVGVSHQMGSNVKIDVTAYYKDVKDLTEVVNQPVKVGRAFASFRNADFGTVKGLEFALNMRRTNYITLNLSYTLAYANGTGSFTNSHRNIAWTASTTTVPPKMVAPLDFDQRHKISAMVDIRAQKGEGIQIGNVRPLENAGVNFVFNAGSGKAYTPAVMANEVTLGNYAPRPAGPINSSYGPWTMRLDLKANKVFSLKRIELDFYVWVLNLFDKDNAIHVFETSGLPDNTDWLSTPEGQQFIQKNEGISSNTGLTGEQEYELAQRDPSNYDIPRMIRFGVRIGF
jgi:outer membrane receptor protein involved in Fe transport